MDTRRKFFRLSASFAVISIVGIHIPAYALFGGGTGIVFDPTNYVKNSMTAIQQYLDTANGYVQMAQDVKQTARKLNNQATGELGLNSKEMQQLREFIETGKSVHGALRQTQQIKDNMDRVFAASKYTSWDEFVKAIGEKRAHGDKMATSLYESALIAEQNLKKSHDQHMNIVGQMGSIEGVTDAAISTAQTVGIIVQQNQGMMQLMAESARVQGQQIQREEIERQNQELAKKQYYENAQQLSRKEREFLRSGDK